MEDELTAQWDGLFTRLTCGACQATFEVEDHVADGERVTCDLCQTEQAVEGAK